jgi:PIN domain nuclease of toxin-antitoxin system
VTTVLLDTHVVHWWSAEPNRVIAVTIPIRSWLEHLSSEVRTIGITPAIADTAVSLPSSFPGDPADRLIYATAIENGWRLITKDQKLRDHHQPRPVTLW